MSVGEGLFSDLKNNLDHCSIFGPIAIWAQTLPAIKWATLFIWRERSGSWRRLNRCAPRSLCICFCGLVGKMWASGFLNNNSLLKNTCLGKSSSCTACLLSQNCDSREDMRQVMKVHGTFGEKSFVVRLWNGGRGDRKRGVSIGPFFFFNL